MSLPAPLLQALVSVDGSTLPQQHALEAPQRLPRMSTAREKRDPLGFDALREAAIQLAQEASRTHWTDFNLHDPGVTLLEAFSYALSEDIYASRQSVPELLGLLPDADAEAAAISEAALARHALHGPRQALPCRPSTARDYQRWLYDLWPEARHLRIQAMSDRRGRPTGLWQLARQAHQADLEDREQAQAQTRAYWAQRNLGEDLLDAQQLLQPRWVRLRCRLRVDGQRDLAELLADLLARCDDYIAARPLRRALKDQPDCRHSGPLMSQGWVSGEELERCQSETLKFNDLALFLRETPGVLDIDELRLEDAATRHELSDLSPEQRSARTLGPEPDLLQDTGSMPMRGPGWALRLAWPASARDLEGWNVSGQGCHEQLPLQQLWQQLEDVRRTPRRQALPEIATQPSHGARDPAELNEAFVPASQHLPEIYRHPGRPGQHLELQAGSSGQRQQWQAYLALMEQWLAHSRAQRQHLGELFDIGRALGPSYWWDLPGNAQLSELEAVEVQPWASAARPQIPPPQAGLYLQPRELLQRELFGAADEAVERRSRVLDQLLALHGEQFDSQALQGLPCYWAGTHWARHLLRCKQRFTRQLLALTRDRHAAFDYSRPLLGRRDNRCPLAQRLALQLGMALPFPRLLMPTLDTLGLTLLPEDPERGNQEAPALPADSEHQALHLLPGSRPPRRRAELRQLWQTLRAQLPWLRRPLAPALLRSAVHSERFFLLRQAGQPCLYLSGERRQQRWPLARLANEAQALQLASELHQLACALQRHAEGLHLLEHQLLRPPGPGIEGLSAFHRQKLSLVLPAWTARGADARFQALCRDTLLMAAPAHLECRVLFLDAQAMAGFEACYARWLEARRQHCEAQQRTAAPDTLALRDAAAALSQFLRPFWACS